MKVVAKAVNGAGHVKSRWECPHFIILLTHVGRSATKYHQCVPNVSDWGKSVLAPSLEWFSYMQISTLDFRGQKRLCMLEKPAKSTLGLEDPPIP